MKDLQEATIKALYDSLEDNKEVTDVEGLVEDILVVTDPKISSEEYDEVIERAQEIVEDTEPGNIPFDEEYVGEYLQTCPICGSTFVEAELLQKGTPCPICLETPEAFVLVGKIETDEEVAAENDINDNEENSEEDLQLDITTNEEKDKNEEEMTISEEEKEEKIEASEELKISDNKLQENKEIEEEGFFNLYKDYKDLYGIDKYTPDQLIHFLNEMKDMNRISEKDYKILTKFANDYQALIDNCGYESQLVEDKEILQEDDRINFKKYNINREPKFDFYDDGASFKGYICNDIPITYLREDGQVYLAIRVDYLNGLTYDEYSKLPSYKDCDKYNGVSPNEVDLADVVDICNRIKKEYEEAVKNVKEVSDEEFKVYSDKYLEKAKKEYEEAKEELKKIESEDLINASDYDIKRLRDNLKYLKDAINNWSWEKKSSNNQLSRRQQLEYDSKGKYEEISYSLKTVKDFVDRILSKKSESLYENKEEDIREIMEIINENKEIKNESNSDIEDQKELTVTKTNIPEFKLIEANEAKIKELENGSAFTWEGMDVSENNLKSITEFFKKNTPTIMLPITFYTWKGKLFNEIYGLSGNNAYKDDLNFLSIDLSNWDGIGALPMIKFQVGARWLDDIVDNNKMRNKTENKKFEI